MLLKHYFRTKNIDNIRLQIYTTWKNKQIKNRLQIHIGSIQIKGNANIHLTKKQYKTNIHIHIPHIQDIPYISQNTIQGTCAVHLQSQGTFTKNNTNISCQFPTLHIGKITYRDLDLQANLNYDDHYIQTQCDLTFPQGNITTQGNIHLKTTTYQTNMQPTNYDIQNFLVFLKTQSKVHSQQIFRAKEILQNSPLVTLPHTYKLLKTNIKHCRLSHSKAIYSSKTMQKTSKSNYAT